MPTPRLRRLSAALAVALVAAMPLSAQDLFSPAIVVNDRAVTGWEIDQRQRLLAFFSTPGDVAAEARTQLVEDRLKQQELDRVGFELTPEGLARALDDFAGRANLDAAGLTAVLEENGVAPETLRDYVAVNVGWREYVNSRFGDRITVTDAEIDQRLAQEATAAAGIEILLSEIIIPAPPERAAEVQQIAEAISRATSEAEFEAAAREYSALPSREQGGRLDWAALSNYPAGLQAILLELAPGEVTAPIPLDGAVAVLQLRGLREGPVAPSEPTEIDYAVLRIPGGLTAPALAEAQRVAAVVDACDDLYGLAQGLSSDRLLRETVAPAALPPDIALALAPLDANEAGYGLTADGGQTLLFVMLCARTYPLPEGAADRDAVATLLRGERLTAYADAVVADLRAAATIVGE